MPQSETTPEPLKPYWVTAQAGSGNHYRLVLLTTPSYLAELQGLGGLLVHTSDAQEVLLLSDYVSQMAALHEQNIFLQNGGVLV